MGNNVNISSAVAIQQTSGPRFDLSDATFDRFISTYVLDLLSEENIDSLLSEAYRILRTGGLLAWSAKPKDHKAYRAS